ncbi:MAG: WD40 repeat domain-containing protein, partial [Scytonema sp. CRU_2_7]|nr:WD40 repeat domain-containing protein [Scytonema sp. CRU_2_7]
VTGKQIKTLSGHRYWVNSISFSRDGKTLASASGDYTIKLWDIATGKQLNTLTGHRSGVSSVSFSPDGKTLASASYDRTIKLWNVATGKLLKTLFGHRSGVSSVSFSPDGKTLASASYDRTIILWNLESDLWNLDLDNLLVRDCHWVRNYLQNNPYVNESDKHLCDDIKRLP